MSANAVVIPAEQEQELSSRAQIVVSRLRAIQVTDQDSCDWAGVELKKAQEQIKIIEAFFGPMKKQASDLHKTICAREKAMLEPITVADKQTRDSLAEWLDKKAREDRARDAAQNEEARKREEADRKLAAENAKSLGASEEAVQQIL